MNRFSRLLKLVLALVIISICLFGYVLHSQSGIFCEFQTALLSADWMLLVCLAVWCGSFIFLTFSLKDLLLIGLLLIAIAAFFIGYPAQSVDAVILLAGVTLGKGMRLALDEEGRMKNEEAGKRKHNFRNCHSSLTAFLVGLVVLLVFASWWHLDVTHNFYPGTRWTGLWDNPNVYGMLMGAGTTLAIGLLAISPKSKAQSPKLNKIKAIFLSVAIFMMSVGLVMSYSRGAWLGTATGLLYLAWSYGKLKWRFVLPVVFVMAAAVVFFWHSTPDNAPWYIKRMDFGRPSAQHRVSAWRGALEMMRDYPLGVGWNKAVSTYEKKYSPPENGAAALTMNSYLMLGTEVGIPALLCFVAYVGLSISNRELRINKSHPYLTLTLSPLSRSGAGIACRGGALILLVAFWFDGGLFDLPMAAVFWVLLELGTSDLIAKPHHHHQS